MHISRTLTLPDGELRFRFSRSGGPGGQNVNTRDTKVEVIFDVATSPALGPRQRARLLRVLEGRLDAEGKLHVVSSDERTQGANRQLAVEKLRSILAEGLKADPAPRRPTRPSKSSVHRRLESKRARGRLKQQRGATSDE